VAIPQQLRQLLAVPDDPSAFLIAAFRQWTAPLTTIHNRVITRLNVTRFVVVDADPRKAGNQRAEVRARHSGGDPGQLAVRVALAVTQHGAAALYVDEGRRWLAGLPVGSGRSLDLDENADPLARSRMLDPITLTIIVGVAVPLICALIPGLLPMVIDWGRGAFSFVTGSNTPAPDPQNATGIQAAREASAFPDLGGAVDRVLSGSASTNDAMLIAAAAAVVYLVVTR
jgi:hypothetical protein